MNKSVAAIAIIVAIGFGFGAGIYFSKIKLTDSTATEQFASKSEQEVVFWRNPMNPAITSPVFMKDEMGMDYLPVYAEEQGTSEPDVVFWRNPMNPAITSPVFMKDEMGMDYLPVYANEGGSGKAPAGTVTIDPVTVQNIGVRTTMAERRTLARQLNALGHVDFNEEKLARLHPKTSGWIEKLNVDETGIGVNHDTILLNIYSPDLVAAQREYLVALANWKTARKSDVGQIKQSAKRVLESARERLELFDVPKHQITELTQSRKVKKQLHIHSPFSGRVMHIGAREGQYVTPNDELYLIADLKRVWVYVDVYEDDLPWIKIDDKAEMTVRAAPGRLFTGKVGFIYPTLDSKTRSVRVRIEFDNSDLILKPGMFATVKLYVDEQDNAVVVPNEAIVRSGNREQVFVVRQPGKFEPREVTLGFSADGFTQILAGVDAGEEVVTSAQFLIDSESKLREATAKMMASMADEGNNNTGMSDMAMDDMSMDGMSMDNSDDAMEELDMTDMDMSDMSMEE